MILSVGGALTAMLVAMALGWLLQRVAANGGWTDVVWTYGTGAVCAAVALAPFGGAATPDWRQIVVAALVGVWSLRLGTYVALRVARGAEDARYAALRREWGEAFQTRLFGLMIAQAPASAVLAASVLLAARNPAPSVRATDVTGLLIALGAILGESVADKQMKRFKADPTNHGRVCDEGLWAWSRHPNYFFEFAGWIAYPVIAFDPARPWTLAALAAPALMLALLRYGSGVPPLETAMLRSKGEAYRRYQAQVSTFLPRPPKISPRERTA